MKASHRYLRRCKSNRSAATKSSNTVSPVSLTVPVYINSSILDNTANLISGIQISLCPCSFIPPDNIALKYVERMESIPRYTKIFSSESLALRTKSEHISLLNIPFISLCKVEAFCATLVPGARIHRAFLSVPVKSFLVISSISTPNPFFIGHHPRRPSASIGGFSYIYFLISSSLRALFHIRTSLILALKYSLTRCKPK
mmetsp:Transcript_21684/g.24204  ORF Transcript_21684/g.24204 Transcript_21684/m.24204 type:complete len:200 (+) Transcript_21684:339-938(+)